MSDSDVYVTFGGDTSELEAEMVELKGKIRETASELSKAVRESTAAPGDDEARKRALELSAALTELKTKFGEVSHESHALYAGAKEAGEGFAELKEKLMEAAELGGLVFTADAIKEWALGQVEAAENIENAGRRMGASVQQVQQLMGLARSSGVDFGGLEVEMERLQLQLAKVGEKASPAAAALKALGLSADELRGHSPAEQIATLAEAFGRFGDGPTKTAAAMALLGKAGAEMIPVFDKGKEGVEELNATLERTNFVTSGETLRAFVETKEAINELGFAASALSTSVFEPFNGVLRGVVTVASGFVEALERSYTQGGLVKGAVEALAVAFKGLEEALAFVAAAFEALLGVADAIILDIGARWSRLVGDIGAGATLMKQAFDSLLPGGGSIGAAWDNFTSAVKRDADQQAAAVKAAWAGVGASVGKTFEDLVRSHRAIWTGTWLAADGSSPSPFGDLSSSPFLKAKPQVPQLNLDKGAGRDDAAKTAEAEAAAEVEAFTAAATRKRGLLEQELKDHEINMSSWLAQTRDALNDEAQDIKATYDAELQTAGLTSAEKIKIATEEAKQLDRISKELSEAQAKYTEDVVKTYESVAGQISGAFASQFDKILEHQQSWGRAMAAIAKDLTLKLVNESITFTAKWIADAAARTVAGVASAETQETAAASSASAGLAASAAAAVRSILSSAAESFAGVFAFLAPGLGPAAAGPAAAAYGTVAGMAGAVASADIGMWQVPSDQLALVHHNELIMPAAQAGAFRDMLAGGSGGGAVSVNPSVNLHVSAIDGASVKQWMRNNSGQMVKAIDEAVRHGAALGTRRLRTT